MGVGMLRRPDHFLDGAVFNDPPVEHDHHPPADLPHHCQVVTDEQRGPARELCVEQVEDLFLHDHVERGGRFVADHQIRPVGQGHGDQGALPLPTGELMREGVGDAFRIRQPDTIQPFQHEGPDPSPAFAVVQGHHLAHLAADPHGRVQCRHRFLENHRDRVATKPLQFLLGASHEFPACQPDRSTDPGVLGQQAHDGQRYHGFPGTGLPDDA